MATTVGRTIVAWDVVRSIQEMCESLRRSEASWSAQHFAELKQPRWLLLARTLQQPEKTTTPVDEKKMASFDILRPKVLAAWQRWLTTTTDFSMPPAALVTTPVPLGLLVLQSITNPATSVEPFSHSDETKTWVAQFAKKPADIQLLFWLHLLTPNTFTDHKTAELVLWNAVTVIQNSPLPFLIRAKLTLLAYQQPLSVPPPPPPPPPPLASTTTTTSSTMMNAAADGGLSVVEMGQMAEQGGVGEHWWRCLWESMAFTSTSLELKNEIQSSLIGRKAPDSEKVYHILSRLDKQNQRQKPLNDAVGVIQYMIHITHILALLQGGNDVMNMLMTVITQPLLWRLSTSSTPPLKNKIIKLAQTLHLHSLMTLAQMRRAVALFWTLLHAISSPHK
jgi:hypothetical protein